MIDAIFAIPGDLSARSSRQNYNRRVMSLMPAYGVRPKHLELSASGNIPDANEAERLARLLIDIPPSVPILMDACGLGVLPIHAIEGIKGPLIVLVHRPSDAQEDIIQNAVFADWHNEQAACTFAHRVIVTSSATSDYLIHELSIDRAKIVIAEPGTDPAPRATGTGTPLQLLALGAVTGARRFDVLVAALAGLEDIDWRLAIVGAVDRDAAAVEALSAEIERHRLGERVTLMGQVVPATRERLLEAADLFIMTADHEGTGVAITDALARGLPIICPEGGRASSLVPPAAALKVAPGNRDALHTALATLLKDRKLRTRLSDASWDAGRALPTWNETARRVVATLVGLSVGGRASAIS